MKYSSGDVAKLLGISKESIRYFEKHHYIEPPARTDSGYRYYDILTAGILRWFQLYRKLDFSQDEASELVRASAPEDAAAVLQHGIPRLHEKIAFLQKVAAELEAFSDEMLRARAEVGKVTRTICPALYRISFEYKGELNFKKLSDDYLKHWHEQIPLVKSTPLWHYSDLINGTFHIDSGLGIFERDLTDREILREEVQYLPERPCYTGIFKSNREPESENILRVVLEEMEKNGHRLSGDAFSRPVALWMEEGHPYYCQRLWVPYQ